MWKVDVMENPNKNIHFSLQWIIQPILLFSSVDYTTYKISPKNRFDSFQFSSIQLLLLKRKGAVSALSSSVPLPKGVRSARESQKSNGKNTRGKKPPPKLLTPPKRLQT